MTSGLSDWTKCVGRKIEVFRMVVKDSAYWHVHSMSVESPHV